MAPRSTTRTSSPSTNRLTDPSAAVWGARPAPGVRPWSRSGTNAGSLWKTTDGCHRDLLILGGRAVALAWDALPGGRRSPRLWTRDRTVPTGGSVLAKGPSAFAPAHEAGRLRTSGS